MQTRSYYCVYLATSGKRKRKVSVIVSSAEGRDAAIKYVQESEFSSFELLSITPIVAEDVIFVSSQEVD